MSSFHLGDLPTHNYCHPQTFEVYVVEKIRRVDNAGIMVWVLSGDSCWSVYVNLYWRAIIYPTACPQIREAIVRELWNTLSNERIYGIQQIINLAGKYRMRAKTANDHAYTFVPWCTLTEYLNMELVRMQQDTLRAHVQAANLR